MGTIGPIADLAPWVSVIVPIVGGLWAFARLRAPDVVARPDRGAATWLAMMVAASLGLIAATMADAFMSFFGGQANLSLVILAGLAVAGLTFLGSLMGYALLARRSVGSIALIGVVLGPIVVAGPIVGAVNLRNAGDRAQVAQERAAAEARGRIFTLTVQGVRPIPDDQGQGLLRVEVDATLHASVDFSVGAPDVWPSFVILPVDAERVVAQSNPVGRVPATLAGGTDLAVALRFPGYSLSPGAWRIRGILMGPGGQHSVTVPLNIAR